MTLSKNWFCEGLNDFEYKQYIVLAYLQGVEKEFSQNKLYSSLSDLLKQYHALMSFQLQVFDMESRFHYEIESMDLETKRLKYNENENRQEEIETIKDIVDYGLEQMKSRVLQGTRIYDAVSSIINFFDVGMLAMNKNEGYLIILHLNQYYIYQYKMSPLILNKEKHNSLNLKLVDKIQKSFTNTFENVKLSLLRDSTIDSPSVFGTDFLEWSYPYNETVLPVIKREFMLFLKKEERKQLSNVDI